MATAKKVLLIGLEPTLVDFANLPQLNAEKVMAALRADEAALQKLGYDARLCLVDLGATAEATVREQKLESFDCILIGAGVRTLPEHFALFERLINLVHAEAPQAKIAFNTKPGDTAEAVQRWV